MTHEPRYFLNNSPLGVSIVGWYTWKLNPSCVWSFHDLLCFEHRFIMSHFFWHVFFIYFPARHTANAHALILQQFFFPTVGFFSFFSLLICTNNKCIHTVGETLYFSLEWLLSRRDGFFFGYFSSDVIFYFGWYIAHFICDYEESCSLGCGVAYIKNAYFPPRL